MEGSGGVVVFRDVNIRGRLTNIALQDLEVSSLIVVSAAIIVLNDKVLITKRGETKSLANLWEFPGGKVEENESPEECVVREIQEELDIHIKILRHYYTNVHTYDFGNIKLIAFLAEYYSGEIKLRDHSDFKWIHKEELKDYKFAPADIPIVEKLLEESVGNSLST